MNADGEAREELIEGVIEGWTAAEARVIHEFCQRLSDRFWERYEEVLIEHLLKLDRAEVTPEPPALDARIVELVNGVDKRFEFPGPGHDDAPQR